MVEAMTQDFFLHTGVRTTSRVSELALVLPGDLLLPRAGQSRQRGLRLQLRRPCERGPPPASPSPLRYMRACGRLFIVRLESHQEVQACKHAVYGMQESACVA